MFIGHYAPALALKPVARGVPLWALFVAVQLVDLAWDVLVLIGVEHVRIVPGFTATNDLDLYDMPWTHSLLSALVWSAAATAATWALVAGDASRKRVAAACVGVAVLSHWVLDAIVHAGDLTLAGDGTPRVGLGLWNHPIAEIALEVGLVIAAGAFAARAAGARARPTIALTCLLVAVAVIERVVPPPASVTQLVLSAFAAYVVLALAARRVDRIEARDAGGDPAAPPRRMP